MKLKAYHVVVIIAEISVVGALFGYVGYIIWDKVHNKPDKRPHIILIVAEDLGWNDVSFHGENEIHTPNIDALAYNGVILNRHYVLPTARPSRISLMTGRYAVGEGTQGVSTTSVSRNVTFMSKFLRDLGYETKLLGPWDLGDEFQYVEDQEPAYRGFDYWHGYYSSSTSHVNESSNEPTKNGSKVIGYDLPRNGSEYFSDVITDEAVKIIKSNANKKPLFLEISNLASGATLTRANPLNSSESFAYIGDENRRRRAEAIKALDNSVGRVVKALSDAGMLKNSIVVFMSSNGAPTSAGSNYPLRGAKNTPFEGGVRGTACVFSALIRKPMKSSWKYVHATDWLPTLYSAAGGHVSRLGEIDGVDQWESLAYDRASPRQRVLLELLTGDREAAIVGRYKLVKVADKSVDGGYYGDSGDGSSYPVYDVVEALNSTAGRAISELDNFFSATEDEAWESRERAGVFCRRPANYPKCASAYCLFDIVGDPCETRDLSKLMPNDTLSLKSFIDGYRQLLVPRDPCSLPKYSNGTWRKDGANSSMIIPNYPSQNNTMKNNTSMSCCKLSTNSMKNHTSMNNHTVLDGGVKNNTSTRNTTIVINRTKNNTIIHNDTAITSNAENNTNESLSPWDKIWKFMSNPIKN